MLKLTRGSKIWKFGETVAAATIGDYLVDLDLWTIISWVTDCLRINECVEFFQMSRFPEWKAYILLIIDDGPI